MKLGLWQWGGDFSSFFWEATQQRCKGKTEPFSHTHLSLKGKEAALHLCLRALKALNVAPLPGLSPAPSCAVNTHYDTGHPSEGNAQLSASGPPRNLTRNTLLTHCCPDTGFISVPSIFREASPPCQSESISSFYMHDLQKNIFIRTTQKKVEKEKWPQFISSSRFRRQSQESFTLSQIKLINK